MTTALTVLVAGLATAFTAMPARAASAQASQPSAAAAVARQASIVSPPPAVPRAHLMPARGTHVASPRIGTTNTGPCQVTNACGSGNLALAGGPVQENPAAYAIFWGSFWNTSTGVATKQIIVSYFNDMGHTGFDNVATQYYDANQHIANTLSFGGSWVDSVDPTLDTTHCVYQGTTYPAVDDSQLTSEVAHAIASASWSDDPNNATYFVYTPSNDLIYNSYFNDGLVDGTGCSDLNVSSGYCAYHGYYYGASAAQNFAYAAMPFPDHGANSGAGSICPAMRSPNGNLPADSLVNLTSHEQMEAITDPRVGSGWTDGAGYENGDKCAWIDVGVTTLNNNGQFSLQPEYSNLTQTCLTYARTWYFAEGYTAGTFQEYLTLANPTSTTANVRVEYLLGGGVAPITTAYTVNANARKTIYVNDAIASSSDKDVSMVVFADQPIVAERPMYFAYTLIGTGTVVPGGTDTLGANSLGTRFTFGYLDTSSNHNTFLTVLNPNQSAITVTVNYYGAGGGAATVLTHTVSGSSRGTIYVNGEGLSPGSYSAIVQLSRPGLVERPLYLVDSITGNTGAADVMGVASLASVWNFAEGYTGTGFSERYIVTNLGTGATTATVTFYRTDGTTAAASVSLAVGQQQVVNANSVLGAGVENSATVTSSGTIVAERFMSFQYTGPAGGASSTSIPGASDVIGDPGAAALYQFAEGYSGATFAEYLTLENSTGSSATVTVTYLPESGGAPTSATYTVGAHTRATVYTNAAMPNQSYSMVVSSTQTIVAERPMYFSYNGIQTDTGGSDVIGYTPDGVN